MPDTRIFFCDPPGRSNPESLQNYGSAITDSNYILLHDQEPIHLDIHLGLFDDAKRRNQDLRHHLGPKHSAIITSELDSSVVNELSTLYSWKSYYYFFHGWASLDWYRGYDKTFLIKPLQARKITKTFIAPNRIIAGKRQHRLSVLYHIFKLGMFDNHISCPVTCPGEYISVYDAVLPLATQYPDIVDVFRSAPLPMQYQNETDHPMHSCWLSLFDQSAESLLYLVTETVATGRRQHLTEKIFKPIALGMPFVLIGTRGSLKYLRSYGFRTFGDIWDESYDNAEDNVRIEQIASLLSRLDRLSVSAKQDLFKSAEEIIQHNWNHFYNGGFEAILWQELTSMFDNIARDFN